MKISPDGMIFESECPVIVITMKGDTAHKAAKLAGVMMATACVVRGDTTVIVDASECRNDRAEQLKLMQAIDNKLQILGEVTSVRYVPTSVKVKRNPFQQN